VEGKEKTHGVHAGEIDTCGNRRVAIPAGAKSRDKIAGRLSVNGRWTLTNCNDGAGTNYTVAYENRSA